jgi:hypothetical protein
MGRSRITRDGQDRQREPSRRQLARMEHQAHRSKSRDGKAPISSPSRQEVVALYGNPATPRRRHELDDKRKQLLKEARTLGVLEALSESDLTFLHNPPPEFRNESAEQAYDERLDTVAMAIDRTFWRNRGEAARQALRGLMGESGHLCSRILRRLEDEGFDLERQIPRLTRVEKFRSFALDLERILREFSPSPT